MGEPYFTVHKHPDQWAAGVCHAVVSIAPWQHQRLWIGGVQIVGRQAWSAREPVWRNEVIY
jgi:hypothetical protein